MRGDGTTRITINVPDAVATRLRTYLEAFTSPRHQAVGEADRIPVERKRGQAFCALMEAVDPSRLPAHGGDATTLIVTVSVDQLRRELGTAELGPADKLTAGRYAGSPAPPRSSRPCSARDPRSWTWGAPHGSSDRPSARQWSFATASAVWRGARFRQRGARPITGARRGLGVVAPTSRTAYSSAPGITTGRTTTPSKAAGCPTETCGSASVRRGRRGRQRRRCQLSRRPGLVAPIPSTQPGSSRCVEHAKAKDILES